MKKKYDIHWTPVFKKKWFSKNTPIQIKKKAIPLIRELELNPYRWPFLEPPLQMLQRMKINRYRIAYQVRGSRVYLVYIDHRNVFYPKLRKMFL